MYSTYTAYMYMHVCILCRVCTCSLSVSRTADVEVYTNSTCAVWFYIIDLLPKIRGHMSHLYWEYFSHLLWFIIVVYINICVCVSMSSPHFE